MAITYIKGDATAPTGTGPKILVHVCNDIGKWGKGFVLAISKRWPEPESAYRAAAEAGKLKLGNVQFVPVGSGITVANLVGQRGVARSGRNDVPIRYDAVRHGLEHVAEHAKAPQCTCHALELG